MAEHDRHCWSILLLDNDVLVVDKPAGLCVFTQPGSLSGTLSEQLLDAGYSLYDGPGVELPGVVHRLDRDTSGVIAFARTRLGFEILKAHFVDGRANKRYVALVSGLVDVRHGKIEVPIGAKRTQGLLLRHADSSGRPSVTEFDVIRRFARNVTLLRLRLETGRTHQIRVHCSYIGHPVLGDYTYGYRDRPGIVVPRQMLHASSLEVVLPASGRKVLVVASLPADMKSVLGALST
ncbi:MAG: RluA family pseudouridine synthase [Caldisericota bacterium]|jgi:23S rRNA pseudouridine1911/1915/1917 synthase|nr:RluA family pseudouridine synthase [Caldisericota bacterium]